MGADMIAEFKSCVNRHPAIHTFFCIVIALIIAPVLTELECRAQSSLTQRYGKNPSAVERRAVITGIVSEFIRCPPQMRREIVKEAAKALGPVEWRRIEAWASEEADKGFFSGENDKIPGSASHPALDTAGLAELARADQFAVLVGAGNPVRSVSVGDLSALFAGKITNWKELGGWDVAIRPIVELEDDAAIEMLIENPLGTNVMKTAFVGRVVAWVAANEGACGFVLIKSPIQGRFLASQSTLMRLEVVDNAARQARAEDRPGN
jgi:ABC-type phosphate transport system substrate-binding protein